MLLNAWKSTGSDFFFPFCVSPFQRALESSSGVLSRWNWIVRGSGAGLSKAALSFSIQCTEAETSEVQRPCGPELQSNIPEEEWKWKLEARVQLTNFTAFNQVCFDPFVLIYTK